MVADLLDVPTKPVVAAVCACLAGEGRRELGLRLTVAQPILRVIESIYRLAPAHSHRPHLTPAAIFAGNVAHYAIVGPVAKQIEDPSTDIELQRLARDHALPPRLVWLIATRARRLAGLSTTPMVAMREIAPPRRRSRLVMPAAVAEATPLGRQWLSAHRLWLRGWPFRWIRVRLGIAKSAFRRGMAECRRHLQWFRSPQVERSAIDLLRDRFAEANTRWINGEELEAIAAREGLRPSTMARYIAQCRRDLGILWFPKISMLAPAGDRAPQSASLNRAEIAVVLGLTAPIGPPDADLPPLAETLRHVGSRTRFAVLIEEVLTTLMPQLERAMARPLTRVQAPATAAFAVASTRSENGDGADHDREQSRAMAGRGAGRHARHRRRDVSEAVRDDRAGDTRCFIDSGDSPLLAPPRSTPIRFDQLRDARRMRPHRRAAIPAEGPFGERVDAQQSPGEVERRTAAVAARKWHVALQDISFLAEAHAQ